MCKPYRRRIRGIVFVVYKLVIWRPAGLRYFAVVHGSSLGIQVFSHVACSPARPGKLEHGVIPPTASNERACALQGSYRTYSTCPVYVTLSPILSGCACVPAHGDPRGPPLLFRTLRSSGELGACVACGIRRAATCCVGLCLPGERVLRRGSGVFPPITRSRSLRMMPTAIQTEED